jgi:hypothetical protein
MNEASWLLMRWESLAGGVPGVAIVI